MASPIAPQSTTNTNMNQSSYTDDFPNVIRKPFPKALLIQADTTRRQKTFIGLTSKRFCVTCAENPAHASSLLSFPFNGYSTCFASSAGGRNNSGSDFDVIFLDCENFDSSVLNNNNMNDESESSFSSERGRGQQSVSGLQFVHSTRMKEYSSLQAFVTTSKDFEAQNAAAAERLLAQREKEKESLMAQNNGQGAKSSTALLYNDPRLKHLIGMSFEERKAKEEKEIEERIKKSKAFSAGNNNNNGASIIAESFDEGLQDARKAMRNRRFDVAELEMNHKHGVENARTNRLADVFSADSLVSAPPSELEKHSKPVKLSASKQDNNNSNFAIAGSASLRSFGDNNNNATTNKMLVNDSIIGSDFIQNFPKYEFFRNNDDDDDNDDDENDGDLNRLSDNNSEGKNAINNYSRKKLPDTLIVEGRTVQKLLLQRHRHIIVGMCTNPQTREKFADLVLNTQTMAVENYLKVHPESRHACIPLFDAVVRYPFRVHLDRLESIFVAREESIAQFAETPNLKQLSAILSDLSHRRVGGMLRVCDAPDWRKLTQALEKNNMEQTMSLLQPIPKIFRVAKDHSSGVSTHLTNIAVNDGLTIPMAATNALLRAQADVRRTRERLDLEKDTLDAVNVELEESHIRNQELTARIEKSLEDQKKMEDEVKFLKEQLERKETEAVNLRQETKTSIDLAEEANRQYEILCGSQVKTALDNEKAREYYEYEIDRLKKMNGIRSRGGGAGGGASSNNPHSSSVSYANVGGTAVPIKNVVKNNNNSSRTPSAKNKSDTEQSDKQQQPLTPVPPPPPPNNININSNSNNNEKGSAFRSFNGSLANTLRQDARTVEVDIGLDAPIYLDLLTESRVKCLSYMRENSDLRQQLFLAHSRIFQLINAHVDNLESLGLIKFQVGAAHHHHHVNHNTNKNTRNIKGLTTFNSSLTEAPTQNSEEFENAAAASSSSSPTNNNHARHEKVVDNYFASFRRSNQGSTVHDFSAMGSSGQVLLQESTSFTRSRTTSLQPQFSTTGNVSMTGANVSITAPSSPLLLSQSMNNNNMRGRAGSIRIGNNNTNEESHVLSSHQQQQQQQEEQKRKELTKQLNKKWKQRLRLRSQFYERQVMEAQDLVSCFTIEENVMNLVKNGVKFTHRIASLDFDKLREVRCRAEFADDAVRGALETDSHAVITQSHLGRKMHSHEHHNTNPMDSLDRADAELLLLAKKRLVDENNNDENNNNNVSSSSATSPSKKRNSSPSSTKKNQHNTNLSLRRRLRNAAINIASTQGSGGTAAAVISSVIETAQNRSREPIRAFLRKNLDQMWTSVRRITQSTMLDVMTTHSALSHGLERLLSGSGFGGTSNNNNLTNQEATTSLPQNAEAIAARMMAMSSNSNNSMSKSSLTSPQTLSLTPQSMNLLSGTTRPSTTTNYNNNTNAPTPLMRREKQQQLAMSLRRLFLDRVVGCLNKLSDSLAEQFSRNIYETYLGAIDVMEEEIHKAVQPVALENAKLATSLLMAKTAAHNQLGLLVKQLKEQHQQIQQKEKELKQQEKKLQQQSGRGKTISNTNEGDANFEDAVDDSKEPNISKQDSPARSSRRTNAISPQRERGAKYGKEGENSKNPSQQQQHYSISSSSLASVLATLDPGNLRLPDYFGKEVNSRDGWCQTRPVLIRDPLTTDIV